jgi:hypothetical protein
VYRALVAAAKALGKLAHAGSVAAILKKRAAETPKDEPFETVVVTAEGIKASSKPPDRFSPIPHQPWPVAVSRLLTATDLSLCARAIVRRSLRSSSS